MVRLLLIWSLFTSCAWAQTIQKRIDTQFADLAEVRTFFAAYLSQDGRFIILPGEGVALVTDRAEHLAALEAAAADRVFESAPAIALTLKARTDLTPRRQTIEVGKEIFVPTEWEPPKIPSQIGLANGAVAPFTPAHPAQFQKRFVGFRQETVTTQLPDGTLLVDIEQESSRLDGFIDYGSPVLAAGEVGRIPIQGQAPASQALFNLLPNRIPMPVFSTTRVSTSVLVKPRISAGKVIVDYLPEITIFSDEPGAEVSQFALPEFRSHGELRPGGLVRTDGFGGTSAEFHQRFFGLIKPSDPDWFPLLEWSARLVKKAEQAR